MLVVCFIFTFSASVLEYILRSNYKSYLPPTTQVHRAIIKQKTRRKCWLDGWMVVPGGDDRHLLEHEQAQQLAVAQSLFILCIEEILIIIRKVPPSSSSSRHHL